MRIFVYLYYLFFILSGGFWHYSFCFWYYLNTNVQSTSSRYLEWFFNKIEITLFLVAFVLLFKPLQPKFHLLFFILLFTLDIYFQNYIKYESSIILTNFTPLLFYFFVSEKFTKYHNEITYGAILFIAVGFLSSFYRKVDSGWLNWSDTVICNYILQFNNGAELKGVLSIYLLKINSHFFWKFADYLTLLFQCSFVLLFFNKKYFLILSIAAVCFHILILVALNIGVFYPYMLVYSFIIGQLNGKFSIKQYYILVFTFRFLFVSLLILFGFNSFDIHFFYKLLPSNVYLKIEHFYNVIVLFLFVSVLRSSSQFKQNAPNTQY